MSERALATSEAGAAQKTWQQEQDKLAAPTPPSEQPVDADPESTARTVDEVEEDELTVGEALIYIGDHCEQIHEKVDQLTKLTSEAGQASQRRDDIINKLHDENQRLRAGEIRQTLEPVLRDLIRLYDDLEKSAKTWGAQPGFEKPGGDLGIFADVTADVLARYGVERFTVAPGKPFEIQEHRVIAAIPTDVREQDRCIRSVVRSGFRSGTRILRSVEVEVFRYSDPAVTSSKSNQ